MPPVTAGVAAVELADKKSVQVIHICLTPVGQVFAFSAFPVQQQVGEGPDAEVHHLAEEEFSVDDSFVGAGGKLAVKNVLVMQSVAAGNFTGTQHGSAEHGP